MSELVLVVDDEPDIAERFRQQFRRETRAGKFSPASRHLAAKSLNASPNTSLSRLIMIFSGVNITGMTGIDCLSLTNKACPEAPVIMIAAHGDAEMRRKAEQGGADAFVVEPIDFTALRGEIDRSLV